MKHEGVDVSITGNSTNPTRFQHLVAGTYKKWCLENGKKYFSVASGGGTGRTLHPDNMAAGPASYGLTDSMGRMHGDAQFAGSSSVPAHVEMMGLIGMGNNPMVGATVACAVAVVLRGGGSRVAAVKALAQAAILHLDGAANDGQRVKHIVAGGNAQGAAVRGGVQGVQHLQISGLGRGAPCFPAGR